MLMKPIKKRNRRSVKSILQDDGILDTIRTADCVSFMNDTMPANSVDLVVTSPPYDDLRDYRGYTFDLSGIITGLYRIVKNGGVVVWVVGDKINGGRSLTSFRQGIAFQDAGFLMHDVMIYRKKNTPFMRKNAYTNCYEYMFILSKGRPRTFNPIKEKTVRHGKEMLVANKRADGINNKVLSTLNKTKVKNNIWEYAVGLGGTTSDRYAFKHPAMFPESLARDHIQTWSKKGDVVYDPMCGAGTTLKMAIVEGRHYIGTDISSEYVKIARRRIKKLCVSSSL